MPTTQKIDINSLIPAALRNETSTSLVSNLFNKFLSEERSVQVSGQIGKITDPAGAKILASNLDRDLNSLIPAIYTKTGTEENVYTFNDMLNRLNALGVDTTDLKNILAEKSFNFAPPIDLDKFVNFSNYFWTGQIENPVPAMPWNTGILPEFYVIAPGANVNDWTTHNYWIHKDEMISGGFDKAIQATRPIIEFPNDLQLNTAFTAQGPSDSGTPFLQTKTHFNQLPQFDLFRYDGTHAGKTSGLFFYIEDPDFEIDSVLQRRAKLTVNADYVFGHGLADASGLLFFKQASDIKSVWAPGVSDATAFNTKFDSPTPAQKGAITIQQISATADSQTWECRATSASEFEIRGSRSGLVGTATVGTPFVDPELTVLFSPGILPFDVDDVFSFSVINVAMPRFVTKDNTGAIVNASPTSAGTWLVPRRMFENLGRELSSEVAAADLVDHFRSIIKAQPGFVGSSFGVNNYRTLTSKQLGFGGTIREFSSNFPLLISNLIQQDLSTLSTLDFAEQQYTLALASIDQFLINELANYISTADAVTPQLIDPNNADVQSLLAAFEEYRADDYNLREVFSDTTVKVKNWPITLPIMGLSPVVAPHVSVDPLLNINVLVHHDGHVSPLIASDLDFDKTLVQTNVTRSDGTVSTGVFLETAPVVPYARQLWMQSTTKELRVFDVTFDSEDPPGQGLFWYKRSTNELREWDTSSNTWILSSQTIASRWTLMSSAIIRNSLVLAVENLLFGSVHPAQQLKMQIADVPEAITEIELAKFAAKYKYDTYAPNYDPIDAFSWNYSSAVIPGVTNGTARWHKIYLQHFDIPGALPTFRPDLEPWKLVGFSDKPSTWDSLWASPTSGRLWTTSMWTMISATHPSLKLCVNVDTDELLPPYVSSTLTESSQALLTSIPPDISNGYVFTDEGPVESVWKKSLEYNYGLARSKFKSAPLLFIDKAWGENFVTSAIGHLPLERGLLRPLPASAFQLHGEKLQNIQQRDAEKCFELIDNTSVLAGVNDVVTFEVTHIDGNQTFLFAYVNGSLLGMIEEGVAFDLVTGTTTIENVRIEDQGIPFLLGDVVRIDFANAATKTFQPAQTKKFNGLGQVFTNLLRFNQIDAEVSTSSVAYRGWQPRLAHRLGALVRSDTLDITTSLGNLPSTAFSLLIKRSERTEGKWITAIRVQLVRAGERVADKQGNYIPNGNGDDWVFRVESYNAQHPSVSYYELDPSAEFQTFHALSKAHTSIAWKHLTKKLGVVQQTTPFVVTGVQNVLNFLFGYVALLYEQGWHINETEKVVIDSETGRNLDWQLEIEKFVDRVYSNLAPGQGHILNPFMNGLWLRTPTGIMSRFSDTSFIDMAAAQAVFDVAGSAIPLSNLEIIRTDEASVTYSDTPMFSGHLFIDEFEHIILFNDKTSDESDSVSIFNTFLGRRIDSAYLSYVKQDEANGKPTFPGYFLLGNEIRRNITSSVDLIADYYDPIKTFAEKNTSKHALALLGFNKKQYFDQLGVNDTTQFNFWRGLVQAKGTNMTVDAFVNYKKFTDASVDEYWAYKVAEYGDSRPRNFPEIKIEVLDCSQHFTYLQFFTNGDTDYSPLPLFTQIERDNAARWFTIDDLGSDLRFNADATTETITVDAPGIYPLSTIFHNAFGASPTVAETGAEMISSNVLKVTDAITTPTTFTVTGFTWTNPTKNSPIKLFDHREKTKMVDIALWHPAIGIHAYEPLEIVNTISKFDPAQYSYSVQTKNNPNFVALKPWGPREVGRVWWDTLNLGYIPYYDAVIIKDPNERLARWGSLAEWASVDLYEWVESDVPPEEYDSVAASEEGNSEIPVQNRASGKVAGKTFYSRNRQISLRPVAWSEAGTNANIAHPSFGPAFFKPVWNVGSAVIVDSGRCNDVGLVAGKHFAGWKNNKPVGEVVLTDQFVYDLGSTANLGTPDLSSSSGDLVDIRMSAISGSRFGQRVGPIALMTKTENDVSYLVMVNDSGESQSIAIKSAQLAPGEEGQIVFDEFGIMINFSTTWNIIFGDDIASDLKAAWVDVYIREGLRYTPLLALPDVAFVNDPLDPLELADPLSVNFDYGWKAWNIPTQRDLDGDLAFPRNMWKPYIGDSIEIEATVAVITDMSTAALTLKSGIPINRYTSVWSDWAALTSVKIEKISNGSDFVSFSATDFTSDIIDANRISIFANGIRVNPQSFNIIGEPGNEVIEFLNILPEATIVLLVYRAFQPTDADLAFNPEIAENETIQTQFKSDYQYTTIDVRSESGAITSAKYYFWVQDKTVVPSNRSMSLKQAKNLLSNGPSQFALFAKIDERHNAYDSCVIAGLNTYVTDNNRYKLRFTRNETLRDDPEQLNLKNVHAEWALLRRSQSFKIPKELWEKMTDAVSGVDSFGNILPAQVRVDYDEQHGTNVRFGFQPGQIFVATDLARSSIVNTILNTSLKIRLGTKSITDFITALDFSKSDEWFKDAASSRATMDTIWQTARARQINEIFFEVLEDALANNYEFSDIFKTSLISVYSTTKIDEQKEGEIEDGIF